MVAHRFRGDYWYITTRDPLLQKAYRYPLTFGPLFAFLHGSVLGFLQNVSVQMHIILHQSMFVFLSMWFTSGRDHFCLSRCLNSLLLCGFSLIEESS